MSKTAICPLLKKACVGHDCAWYAHMVGKDPQTGADMDHWDCAVRWLPVLITEQARQTRGVQAAVESARNEAIKTGEKVEQAVRQKDSYVIPPELRLIGQMIQDGKTGQISPPVIDISQNGG